MASLVPRSTDVVLGSGVLIRVPLQPRGRVLQAAAFAFNVVDSASPLRITLAWTDPPALPFAGRALVNDLDLSLVSSTGEEWLGNNWTFFGKPAADNLNNVEQIQLSSPPPGAYTVMVVGRSIPEGPQKYALVVTGDVTSTGTGQVACPFACRGHGACEQGVCLCRAPYVGFDCGNVVNEMTMSERFTSAVAVNEWHYVTITVDQPIPDDHSLVVHLTRTTKQGDPNIYVTLGRSLPNLLSFDKNNLTDCTVAGWNVPCVSTVWLEDPPSDITVGVYGFCCESAGYSLHTTVDKNPAPLGPDNNTAAEALTAVAVLLSCCGIGGAVAIIVSMRRRAAARRAMANEARARNAIPVGLAAPPPVADATAPSMGMRVGGFGRGDQYQRFDGDVEMTNVASGGR